MIDGELRAALDSIESQWNNAESYVKKVERLRRGLVVGASINEFRYAGRRLVEAYALVKTAENNPADRAASLDLLREVRNFCFRAQHDAIDAAVTYIDQALAKLEDEFGPDLLHEKFLHYMEMKASLQEISLLMEQSRGDRTLRDVLYQGMRDDLVPTLIDRHRELESSTAVLEAAYTRRVRLERRESRRYWITVGVAAVAALAAVVTVVVMWPRDVPAPANTTASSAAVTEPSDQASTSQPAQ